MVTSNQTTTTPGPPDVPDPDPLRDELRRSIQALSAAVQALTQATQVLHGTSQQLTQGLLTGPPAGAGAAQETLTVWEDDPFSEEVPTANPVMPEPISANLPASSSPSLRWQISEPRPAPARYAPGTVEFRYWNAEASLARGVGLWSAALPQGTRWSTFGPTLPVTLVAGQRLNARYTRFAGLEFFQQLVSGVSVVTGDSPDVLCHELGHAVLDAVRPELFDAGSSEGDAFHEAFGDITAMLATLQLPSMRQKILQDTGGRLNLNSRLSRVAEQLGWGIRQRSPGAVDADSLRNAANRFSYLPPASLPTSTPFTQLSAEPHSFARLFTGAFLDALAGMASLDGAPDEATLEAVGRSMGQLLVDGILTAPVTPAYFSQVAAAMVQAAQVRDSGRFRQPVLRAFVRRGILALEAARSLEAAPVPTFQAVPTPAGAPSGGPAGAAPGGFHDGPAGASSVLAFGPIVTEGYLKDASAAPGLPLQLVHAEFLDTPVLVHAAAEAERFSVAPAIVAGDGPAVADATDAARHYLEDLIQLGRIDAGSATGIMADLNPPRRDKTHRLERTGQGMVLKRIQFSCCLGGGW